MNAKYICFILIMGICPFIASSAEKTKAVSDGVNFVTIDSPKVAGFLQELIQKNKQDDASLSSVNLGHYKAIVDDWIKYRFLEVDTEIDRSWFEKVHKLVDYLVQVRYYLEKETRMKNDKKTSFARNQNNYNEAYNRIAELLKDPTPVEKKKLEKLREEKRKWELTQKREKAKSGSIKEDE